MSEYVNLPPGAKVPKSGEYKCFFCGEGGLAEFAAKDSTFGPLTGQLQGLRKQKSQRYFEKGRKFPECSNCGKGTGWSLVDETSD